MADPPRSYCPLESLDTSTLSDGWLLSGLLPTVVFGTLPWVPKGLCVCGSCVCPRDLVHAQCLCATLCRHRASFPSSRSLEPQRRSGRGVCLSVYFFFLRDLTSPKNGLLQGGRSFKQFIRVNKMELTPIIRRPLIRLYIIECSCKVHCMVFE